MLVENSSHHPLWIISKQQRYKQRAISSIVEQQRCSLSGPNNWIRIRPRFSGIQCIILLFLAAISAIEAHHHALPTRISQVPLPTYRQKQQQVHVRHHHISARSLTTNQQQQRLVQFNSSTSAAVDPISLELEPNEQVSGVTPSTCPPAGQSQQTGDNNYYKSLGYTQPQVSNFVRPMFYTLRLKVDPTKRKFTAQLMITLEVLAQANGNVSPLTRDSEVFEEDHNQQQQQHPVGYRYLTLHAGSNIHVKRAFYVYTTRGSIQIPATKIGRDARNELLTIDFHPNVITAGQGLLLIVYSGLVNETESHGLFVHHSLKQNKRIQQQQQQSAGTSLPQGGGSSSMGSSSGNKTQQLDDYGLATHMQPSFARRLFPSWDEPHLKARFSLIVVLPFRGYQTLSNMPIHRKSFSLSCSGEPMQEIEFHTTPIMSTYLLTLVIGHFDHLESITPNNARVRVYVYSNQTQTQSQLEPSSHQQQSNKQSTQQQQQNYVNNRRLAASLALDVAVKTLDRLETLLGVKYPLSKFDMIALRDFNSGGMENWGAAIFHENYLLYEPTHLNGGGGQAAADIQVNGGKSRPRWMVVPLVVAHEIAHQWFGNLITSQSWTYLWLNEGFAQLLMYDLADYLYPEHNYWDMFVEDSRQSAMHDDELLTSSHALEPEVYSTRPLDAENGSNAGAVDQLSLFDEITYNKGALVVRTIYYLLGRDHFFAGLKHYLLKHSYDIVRSHDLWLALEEASGLADGQLESLMRCWLNQEGYPLISVTVLEESAHWRLRLTQTRFTLLPLEEAPLNKSQELSSSLSMDIENESSSSSAYQAPGKPPGGQDSAEPVWVLPVAISSQLNPSPQASELQLQSLRRPTSARPYSGSLITDRTTTLLLPKASTGSWLKLNFNATGHFRVDYQMRLNSDGSSSLSSTSTMPLRQSNQAIDMLSRMVEPIRNKSMCVIDRLNLVDDLFAMVRAGKKPTAYYLRFISQAYEEETEAIVLRSIVDSLKRIKAIVSNGGQRLNFLYDRYVQKYLRKVSLSLTKFRASMEAALNNNNNDSTATYQNGTFKQQRIGPLGTVVADTNQQQQQQQQLKQNINQLKEIEALIEASRIQFNDTEFHQRAAVLFNRNFRQSFATNSTAAISPGSSSSSSSSSSLQGNLFDSMDREMRASIYSGALMSGSRGGRNGEIASLGASVDEPPFRAGSRPETADSLATQPNSRSLTDGLPEGRSQNVTASTGPLLTAANNATATNNQQQQQDPIVGSHSWHSSIFAYQEAPFDEGSSSNSSHTIANSIPQQQQQQSHQRAADSVGQESVFEILLKAYEFSESSGERFAISSALGLIDEPSKQLKLLNLTLFDSYFRQQDSHHLLESMARSKQGRKLIWDQFKSNIKLVERRRLMTTVLKSLSHGGFIEQPSSSNGGADFNGGKIEAQLRNLYHTYSNEYGKVLSISLELLLINSKWFMRDHDGLFQYLESTWNEQL